MSAPGPGPRTRAGAGAGAGNGAGSGSGDLTGAGAAARRARENAAAARPRGQLTHPRLVAAAVESRWRVGVVAALACLCSAMTLVPVLDGGWWIPGALAIIALIAASGMVLRALRVPAPVQPIAQSVVLLVGLTTLAAGDQAFGGVLPRPQSLAHLQDLIAQGRAYAEVSTAPAGPDDGLRLLLIAGIGLVALAVDTLTAGLDLPGMSLGGLVAMPMVTWAIADGRPPAWGFLLIGIAWLLVLACAHAEQVRAWSPGARTGSIPIGAAIATGGLAAALLLGGAVHPAGPANLPGLPGISGLPGLGPRGAVEVDALVSLRRSLVTQDNRIVVTYAATPSKPDYLRLAVLDQFDGVTWSASGGQSPQERLSGATPAAGLADAEGIDPTELEQYSLAIGPLGGPAVPSPAGTVAIRATFPVAWAADSGLPIRSDSRSVEGTRVALSIDPRPSTPAQVRSASRTSASRPPGADGDLGPATGPELVRLAHQITAAETTPYDEAMALQQWFTSGRFRYSTDVPAGSGGDALRTFLTDRVGYCEQFAATMALMARAVGIPARVVVGFTQGSSDGGQWIVRGTDAHAWPELWMGAAGWTRFEPTPGTAVTTSPPTYAQAPVDGSTSTAEDSPAAPDQTSAPAQPDSRSDTDPLAVAPTVDSGRAGEAPVVLAALLILAMVAAPMSWRSARRRSRLRGGDLEAAFAEVVDTATDLGLDVARATPRLTLAEIVATAMGSSGVGSPDVHAAVAPASGRAAPGGHSAGWASAEQQASPGQQEQVGTGPAAIPRAAQRLLHRVEATRYAPVPPLTGRANSPTTAEGPTVDPDAAALIAALRAEVGLWPRMRAALLPRTLLRGAGAAPGPLAGDSLRQR